MIKDKLKQDLIKYIRYLTDTQDSLEDMDYETLLAVYVDAMGLKYSEVSSMINDTIYEYRMTHQEELIDDYQIIDDTGILDPINYLHLMRNRLKELKEDLETHKSHLVMYSGFLEDDLKIDFNDDSLKPEQKTEILNDISHEKWIVGNYPRIINELENKVSRLQYAVSKMDNYHMSYDNDTRKF